MIMNANKTKTGKLLMAVLAMLMLVAGAAIVFSDSTVDAAEINDATDVQSLKDGASNNVITISENTVFAVSEGVDFTGYTINCGTNTVAFNCNVTGGTFNGSTGSFFNVQTNQTTSTITVKDVTINGTGTVSGQTAVAFANGGVTFDGCTINAVQGGVYTISMYVNENDSNKTVTLNNTASNNAYFRFSTNNAGVLDLQGTSNLYGVAIVSSLGQFTDATVGTNYKVGENVTIGITCLGFPAGDSWSGQAEDKDMTVPDGESYTTGSIVGNGSVDVQSGGSFTANTASVPVSGEGTVSVNTTSVSTLEDAETALASNDEVTLTSSQALTISEDFTIDESKTLNILNTTINNAGEFSFLVSGNLNITNSYVYAGVDIHANADEKIVGELSVSGAHTLSADGTGNTNLYVGVGDTLNFTGTIPDQRTIYVYGNLVATDVTVAGTVKSYVGSAVTLNGVANISGEFIMDDADLEIAGMVNVRNDANGGADFQLSGKSSVTVMETGVFNVNKPTAIAATGVNKLTIGADAKFTVEGTLNITGVLSGNVIDKGTINFNGTSDNGSISLYDGITLTVTSVSGKLVVNDTGVALEVIGENRYSNGANASEGNVIELNNVRGVTVTESITSETVEQTRYYYSNMDVSGTFTALDNNTTDASVTIKATTDAAGATDKQKCGEIVLSGTSAVGVNVTLINQGKLTVTGDLTVTRSSSTGTSSGVFNNTSGEVTVEGSIVMYTQLAGTVNAMYYTVTGTEFTSYHYTGFAAAIAAAGDADSDTVYVQGKVTVAETADIAAGTYVSVGAGAELTIEEGVTLTVADTAALNVIGTVDVDGTLVITNTDTGLSYGTLEYDVYTVNGKTATYTNLANALANSNPGDVITIAQDVTLSGNTTIPAEVTVQTGDNAIILKDNVTLTVEGTLAIQRNGELRADTEVTTPLAWGTDVKLVVDGVVSSVDAAADADMTEYKASGAVFQIRNLYYLTSVEYAAGVSEQVEDYINVYGSVTFGDVVFTEGENNTLAVNFQNMTGKTENDTFRGNVTIDGATMNVVSGLYSGSITAAANGDNAVIALNGASNVSIGSGVDESGLEPVDVMTIGGIAGTAAPGGSTPYIVNGNVTIQSGTVNATNMDLGADENGTFTVASGATMIIGEHSTVGVNATAENGLTVDGTVVIDDGAFAVGAGSVATVNGTMTLENTTGTDVSISGTINVSGTLDISAEEDTAAEIAVSGTMLVGAIPDTLGQETSGAVNGEVALNGMIIVYTGSSIENIDVGNAELVSTTYYINETEYATAYTFDGTKTIVDGLGTIELDAVDFDSEETKWYSDDAMTKEITWTSAAPAMTSYENVYISAPISERTGTISAGTGLDLYIDNIRWDASLGYRLAVGTHTVSFDVRAGYDGTNATITFNGQTVENGGTIEITANGFVLVANGAVPSSGQIVVDGGDNGGSDGMGLTDYLLIILVVLIVIMAIMVAMRLMRS